MAHVTLVVRCSDGFPLLETLDRKPEWAELRPSFNAWFRKGFRDMPARGSLEKAGNLALHYVVDNGMCHAALFDAKYPRNLAFAFVEDVRLLVWAELQREFGTGSVDYRSRVEVIEKPYVFNNLERQVRRKCADYQDTSSSKALDKLNAGLSDVSNVMRQNIDLLMQRGEDLQVVNNKADRLRRESSVMKNQAKRLNLQKLVQRYAIPAVIFSTISLILCMKLM